MDLKHLEVSQELHTCIKTASAIEGVPMKQLTERYIRLGMIAEAEHQPRMAEEKAEYHADDH